MEKKKASLKITRLAWVTLLASTITTRNYAIADDIYAQLLERINESPLHIIQVDDFNNVDNEAIMLVVVQCIFQEDLHEDMFCELLLP